MAIHCDTTESVVQWYSWQTAHIAFFLVVNLHGKLAFKSLCPESVTPSPSIFTVKFHPYESYRVRQEQLDMYSGFLTPSIINRHGVKSYLRHIETRGSHFFEHWSFERAFQCQSLALRDHMLRPLPLYLNIVRIEDFTQDFNKFP